MGLAMRRSSLFPAMTATAATKQPSFIEDVVDMFYAPSAVFARRRTAGYGLALLLYAVLMSAMFYAARPVMRPMMELQRDKAVAKIQANPNIQPQQKEDAVRRVTAAFDSPYTMLGPVLVIPITVFVAGFGLWICGKLMGSSATYGQTMMVTTFSQFPRLLTGMLVTAHAVATDREVASQYALTLSPAALLPDTASPLVGALLSRFDLGVLWATALMGIGVAIVGKLTRSQGMIVAALAWVLGGIVVALFALREMAG